MQHLLKVLVQRIKESITETPEEEENSNKRNRPDGFSQGELRCLGDFLIRDLERSLLEELFGAHDECITRGKKRKNYSFEEAKGERASYLQFSLSARAAPSKGAGVTH